MQQYALLINNELVEIRHFEEQPENIPHKNVEWLPVVLDINAEQDESFRDGNTWVIKVKPPRRTIEKATIMARLTDAQLEAALSLVSIRQQERWRMPGYPSVYADDPEVVGLIQAVGANPEEVLA